MKIEHEKTFFALIICLIIFTIFVTGCVSSQSVQKTSTPSTISKTCIGECKISQSATDGYYNHQQITLNQVTVLKQPYIDPDPNIGKEWHNWDWLVLNISIKNLRPEKAITYGIDELTDADGKSITCFESLPLELTTFDFDLIKTGETRTGNIACVLSPEAKTPLKFEYGFDSWSEEHYGHGKHAIFFISNFENGNYATIEKNPNGRLPDNGGVKPRTP